MSPLLPFLDLGAQLLHYRREHRESDKFNAWQSIYREEPFLPIIVLYTLEAKDGENQGANPGFLKGECKEDKSKRKNLWGRCKILKKIM